MNIFYKRLSALLQTTAGLEDRRKEKSEEYDRLVELLAFEEERNAQLEEEVTEILTILKEHREKFEEKGKKWEDVQKAEEKQKEHDAKLAGIIKENDELRCVSIKYFSK